MFEISIPGLNARQRVLADIIWSMESKDDIDTFIRTLPRREARDAQNIVDLMIMACIDQLYDESDSTYSEAQAVINKVRGV